MQLVQNDKPIEARHFGYGVLQFIVNKRFGEFSDAEKHALASLCYDKLREVGNGVTIGVTRKRDTQSQAERRVRNSGRFVDVRGDVRCVLLFATEGRAVARSD